MKFRILGSAAAEAVPAIFCHCAVCETARRLKGKNIRTRSQGLVNDDLLVDFPPDTFLHVLNEGIDSERIRDVIFTHSHSDHLFPPDICYRQRGFAPVRRAERLRLYGNEGVQARFSSDALREGDQGSLDEALEFHVLHACRAYRIGQYEVHTLKADHMPGEETLLFVIRDQAGKTILYGNDTGFFPEMDWTYMAEQGFRFDLVSLDCCFGWKYSDCGHMGMETCVRVKERLLEMGAADEHTVFVVTHFSHNGLQGDAEDLARYAAENGFVAAYDGIEFDI